MKPYNVKGKGRHYKSPATGKDIPSVTNILNCYPKQQALVPWSANEQKAKDLDAAYALMESGWWKNHPDPTPEKFREALDDFIGKRRAHRDKLKAAGEIGKAVHFAVECKIKKQMGLPCDDNPTLEDAALWAYMVWEEWWSKATIIPSAVEKFVYSDFYGFGGTTDLIAQVMLSEGLFRRLSPKYRDDRTMAALGTTVVVVADYKTSKGIYDDMLLQIAAYITALTEMGEVDKDAWGMIMRLPKTVEDPEFEVRFLLPEDREAKFDTFLAVKRIWEDKHNG